MKGINYTEEDGKLKPDFKTTSEGNYQIGKYGIMRKTFLKEHRLGIYNSLLLSGNLNIHLQDIDQNAKERMYTLQEEMLKKDPLPNTDSALLITAHRVQIRESAEEIVLTELIYS